MSEYIIKYPLDLTGEAPENRIEGEPHVLEPGLNRSLVPRYGAFYTDSLVVRDADTTEILVANDQYIPIMYHAEASERAGKEICAGIVIIDGTVSDNVIVDYQVVGDVYQNLTQVILDLIENLNLDEREIMWGDLLGRPDAFPPAHHLHDLGDIFGFEYLTQAVNDMRDAVLYGDVASHDELKAMIEARRAELQENIDILRGEYEEHRDRVDNPHTVTKAQTGLGSVANHPLATKLEAEAGLLNSRYMTPLRTVESIQVWAIAPLDEHKADYTNPHRVTKAQVGLGVVENMPLSTKLEAEAGTVNTSYMTPLRVAEAIYVQATVPLTAHENRVDNPHAVTKAQTGLGLVPNFPASSQLEAESGTANNRFMTPLRVAQAITFQLGNAFDAHINDYTNPHAVTQAQVGLSEVPNWIPGTTAHVDSLGANEAAIVPDAFMTPVLSRRMIDKTFRAAGDLREGLLWYRGTEGRTLGAFDTQTALPTGADVLNYNGVLRAVQFHGNGRNLTDMVKAQVGLANVDNFSTSTKLEAEAGTNNSRFMTPLRVAEAITSLLGNAFDAHLADYTNPHQVTKAQVGLSIVDNYSSSVTTVGDTVALRSSDGDINARLFRSEYDVTNANVGMIMTQVDTISNNYLRPSTPAQVKAALLLVKSDVALGSVENLPLATRVESETGTTNSRYMTPLRVAQAITYQAGARLASHMGDTTNPHSVTKAQVGLGVVENYSIASQTEAQAGTSNSRYMTPLLVAQAITQQAGSLLAAHVGDTTNPHSVTKAQVGLGSVTNVRQVARAGDTMTGDLNFATTGRGITWAMNTDGASIRFFNTADSDTDSRLEFQTNDNGNEYFRWTGVNGASTAEYMRLQSSGLTVANRVTAQEFYGNGRNLTGMVKAQVGLGSVDNYATATQAEAQAGTINSKFMTPLRVAEAIITQVGNTMSNHIGNNSNPHNVTKAQVGLSNVDNVTSSYSSTPHTLARRDSGGDIHARLFRSEYDSTNPTIGRIMTQVDTATNNYIRPSTPAQVKAALGITKADVGLGNVSNYSVASQAEAQAGTVNYRFMTPLRVAQAITSQAGATLNSHIGNTNNPHAVNKADVGLSNVSNYSSSVTGVANTHVVRNGNGDIYARDGIIPRLREYNGTLQAVIGGVWRQIWPPQWQ